PAASASPASEAHAAARSLLKRGSGAADEPKVVRRAARFMHAGTLPASRGLWATMAFLALACAVGILAFGQRPLAMAVPASLALGLVLGRSSREGHGAEEIAEQLAETQRQLEVLALRDPLTGVLNHRAFQDALEVELRRARRENWSVAIVAIDVDGFRELNDSRGHEYGDAVLAAVAEGLSADLRPGDLCGRIGGDEFMLALSGCDTHAAQEVVDRLRAAVDTRAAAADVHAVTLSVGIAEFPRHAIGRAELMRFADGAMYW